MKPTITALLFLAFCGCVPHQQWRTKLPSDTAAPVEDRFVIPADTTKNRLYSMAFVEFKNNGDLWDKRQLDEAFHAIDEADRRSNHHALVITFIHGWKNNAKPVNNNVLDLRRQLNRIAADVCHEDEDKQHCGVVGVYLAWSGDLIAREWNTLRTMTYFDRRGTAAHVASNPIGDALFAIMKQTKQGAGRETNHSVIVGHSFGGLILEYAIAKRMKELGDELHTELGRTRTSPSVRLKALDDFADLVVLINQAAPAAQAVTLLSQYRHDLRQVNLLRPAAHCAPGDSSQQCKELTRPLILSVSSTSDLATRAVLPVAETISPPKDRPRVLPKDVDLPKGLDVKKVFTTAAAHTPQLQSHDLLLCENGDCTPCLTQDKFYIPVSIKLPAYAPGNETKAIKKLDYCLVRDFKAWNKTPYWIFQIPPEIVPDHGTIFTDRFTDFLTSFLPPLEQLGTASPTRPQRLTLTPEAQTPN